MEKEKTNENKITIESFSQVWCMLTLNQIIYKENNQNFNLNLIAIGFSNGRIYLINLSNMKCHQIIKESNTIYSLCQFNNNPKYLICSISTGHISIYILKDSFYEIIQKFEKH